jgi:hypothetical protein
MSTEGGISDWVVARLKAQVSILVNRAYAIGNVAEMERIGRNVPSAGVLVMDAVPGENILMNGTQEVLFDVETYVSSRTFRGGSDLTATDGSYDLWDDIYAALVGETPTGASQPLRFAGSGRLIADDGLVLMMFRTRTMVIKQ